MTIKREVASAQGRSLATAYNGIIDAVAYDPNAAVGIVTQTGNALKFLEERLANFKASKAGLLQVTIYLHDMCDKTHMDTVWCDWIGSQSHWPQRACVGADLGDMGVTLIEIVAIAAQTERGS